MEITPTNKYNIIFEKYSFYSVLYFLNHDFIFINF